MLHPSDHLGRRFRRIEPDARQTFLGLSLRLLIAHDITKSNSERSTAGSRVRIRDGYVERELELFESEAAIEKHADGQGCHETPIWTNGTMTSSMLKPP